MACVTGRRFNIAPCGEKVALIDRETGRPVFFLSSMDIFDVRFDLDSVAALSVRFAIVPVEDEGEAK